MNSLEQHIRAKKIHDYSRRFWGHDYAITDVKNGGMQIRMMGWGYGIEQGDYILLVSQSKEPGANPATRYEVESIEYYNDPPDMWTMKAKFAPRPA